MSRISPLAVLSVVVAAALLGWSRARRRRWWSDYGAEAEVAVRALRRRRLAARSWSTAPGLRRVAGPARPVRCWAAALGGGSDLAIYRWVRGALPVPPARCSAGRCSRGGRRASRSRRGRSVAVLAARAPLTLPRAGGRASGGAVGAVLWPVAGVLLRSRAGPGWRPCCSGLAIGEQAVGGAGDRAGAGRLGRAARARAGPRGRSWSAALHAAVAAGARRTARRRSVAAAHVRQHLPAVAGLVVPGRHGRRRRGGDGDVKPGYRTLRHGSLSLHASADRAARRSR